MKKESTIVATAAIVTTVAVSGFTLTQGPTVLAQEDYTKVKQEVAIKDTTQDKEEVIEAVKIEDTSVEIVKEEEEEEEVETSTSKPVSNTVTKPKPKPVKPPVVEPEKPEVVPPPVVEPEEPQEPEVVPPSVEPVDPPQESGNLDDQENSGIVEQ
ncbi:MAG: hypothetical protein ACRCXT_05060 [Paraclostridium sp.]